MDGRSQARDILNRVGSLPDESIDLGEAALALAIAEHPEVDPAPYRRHLQELADQVGAEVAAELATSPGAEAPSLGMCTQALRTVLVDRHGYHGDSVTYDDVQNANLMRVIDRRKGLPVALGILYLHAARAQGWTMVGLNFPQHFLIRLEHRGERAIIDPFFGGAERSVIELRDLLRTVGAATELAPEHYAAVSNRDILLRLQNNIKRRHWRSERFDLALALVENMLLFAPQHVSLLREAGLLHARAGNLSAAIRSFEQFLERGALDEQLRQETLALIQQIRTRLN